MVSSSVERQNGRAIQKQSRHDRAQRAHHKEGEILAELRAGPERWDACLHHANETNLSGFEFPAIYVRSRLFRYFHILRRTSSLFCVKCGEYSLNLSALNFFINAIFVKTVGLVRKIPHRVKRIFLYLCVYLLLNGTKWKQALTTSELPSTLTGPAAFSARIFLSCIPPRGRLENQSTKIRFTQPIVLTSPDTGSRIILFSCVSWR